MNDAETRLAEALRADVARDLGPGTEIEDLSIESGPPARLSVRVMIGGRDWVVVSEGENVVDAYARLLDRALEARIAIGFRSIVER
jgi:hypothetical protein